MAVALTGVQDWDLQATSASTLAYTATGSTITAGRLVEGCIGHLGAGVTVSSVVDNLGNTYTVAGQVVTAADAHGAAFYKENVVGGANPTFTITFTGACTVRIFGFREWSGAATSSALAGYAGNAQTAPATTANAITSTAMTPSANNCAISGWCVSGTQTLAAAAGTNFTRDASIGFPVGEKLCAEKLTTNQTTAASVAATFTDTVGADNVSTFVMAFKEPGGGGVFSLTLDGTTYGVTGELVGTEYSTPLTWLRVGR